MSGVAVTTVFVMQSSTRVSILPRATAFNTMSRSVIMPITRLLSQTGIEPQF
ncbi:hypothetical protein URH17368_2715 [Alicyclobacillus hesperidum URH17-3-68]|nr:hypothetical protein URH17368_2715 [Alicyclobacillus hesperidum URH17-3-68]